jgi:hypothetical protein
MHGLACRCHQIAQLLFIGFNAIPITNEAPLVMEPYANREKLRIELDGGAVGSDRLLESAKTFERRPHIGVRFREIGAQRKGLAISRERFFECLLALQDIAEISVGFGEIWPQRDRSLVALDGFT